MISTQRQRQLSLARMVAHDLRYRLTDAAHKTRVLEYPNRRVVGGSDLLKLVVPVELHIPAKPFELVRQTSFNEMDGASVNASFGLHKEI